MQEIFNKVEQNQLQRTKNVGKFLVATETLLDVLLISAGSISSRNELWDTTHWWIRGWMIVPCMPKGQWLIFCRCIIIGRGITNFFCKFLRYFHQAQDVLRISRGKEGGFSFGPSLMKRRNFCWLAACAEPPPPPPHTLAWKNSLHFATPPQPRSIGRVGENPGNEVDSTIGFPRQMTTRLDRKFLTFCLFCGNFFQFPSCTIVTYQGEITGESIRRGILTLIPTYTIFLSTLPLAQGGHKSYNKVL